MQRCTNSVLSTPMFWSLDLTSQCSTRSASRRRSTISGPMHPRVADHQVLDRGPLRVAEVEAPGDVRRRLDDHERRQRRIGGRARAIGREHVGRQPLLVDVVLELGRDVGARQGLGARGSVRQAASSIGSRTQNAPSSSGRTGSWYHLLVRRRCPPLIAAGPGPASSRRAIGRHPHGSRATFASVVPARLAPSRARSVADPDLLFSVVAVRAGVYHAGFRRSATRRSNRTVDPRAKMNDVGACAPSPETPVDRALIERARGGDRDAYAEVATVSSHRLYAVALRVLRDPDAASDAMQAALVRIWRDLPTLRDPDLYEAWSYRVLLRACSDARRADRRRCPRSTSPDRGPDRRQPVPDRDPRRARARLRDPQPQPARDPRAHVLRGPVRSRRSRRRLASPWAPSSRGSTARATRCGRRSTPILRLQIPAERPA